MSKLLLTYLKKTSKWQTATSAHRQTMTILFNPLCKRSWVQLSLPITEPIEGRIS